MINHATPPQDPTRRAWLTRAMAGGVGVAAGGVLVPSTTRPAVAHHFDVTDFGATGDGITDDAPAIQAALDAAAKSRSAALSLPAGRYRLSRGLTLRGCDRLDLFGDGATTTLVHEADEPLFHWPAGVAMRESSVRHLCFASSKTTKSTTTAVLHCEGGTERSLFSHLLFTNDGAPMGSGIVIDRVADTTTLEHCLMWGPIRGTGIRITRGSEVRIIGGRILGSVDPFKGLDAPNIGIHLTGGNGGVHVISTDLIGLGTSIKIGEPGHPSNREVFLTHATLDSSRVGLWQVDGAYTSVVGCWAASCDEAQILIDESCKGAILSIAGGSIFNGGTYGRPGEHAGIVVRAGTFNLSGVAIRNNLGTGLSVGPNVSDYAVTGCRITENGTGAVLDGRDYIFTGNVLARNRQQLVTRGSLRALIAANVQ